jgi:NADPH:quinone reductase-like Zn-dependent oxidoreductase
MKAVLIDDNQLKYDETSDPVLEENKLIVSVISAGINGADILQKKGGYPAPKPWSQNIPGIELAGKVVKAGNLIKDFQVGDLIMTIVGGGAQAELAVVEPEYCLKIPEGLDPIKAGAFCETFFTAYDALISRAKLKIGADVLIVGAAGGVGTAAIQITSLYKCQTTALVRDLKFKNNLKELGATQVLTKLEDQKYDIILDLVAGSEVNSRISNLKTEGRYVIIGVGAGFKGDINYLKIMEKRAYLTGSTLRSRDKYEKKLLKDEIEKSLIPFVKDKFIGIPIHKTYEFKDANQAYLDFENGGKFGKLVLINPNFNYGN